MCLAARKSLRMRIAWRVSFFPLTYLWLKVHEGLQLRFLRRVAQCPAENCNGDRAYFFQLQIRSADEPMTTFLKVWLLRWYMLH